ncbi:Mitochondrial ribosomal protein L38 [Fasciola hepatica]|uniref:Large ribosomal subunit protein mL38 n=1 Tax=Fasciola hepatica TaxID=6192 RepID=A0A4E0RKU6_FASHE|nr:Mitochondrial ribosomal protein L38 [Fasciola hepatica]
MLVPGGICGHRSEQYRHVLRIISRCFWYRRGFRPPEVEPGSYPFPKKQVPAVGKSSYEDRIAEIKSTKEPGGAQIPLNIGIPFKIPRLLPQRSQPKKSDLESAARKRTLHVPVETVHCFEEDTHAPTRCLAAAQHYDVFKSLFGPNRFFVPQVNLGIYYGHSSSIDGLDSSSISSEQREINIQPVYTGNMITAMHASIQPIIDLSLAPADCRWTLVMSCPDEPINVAKCKTPTNEYVHWIVSNLGSTKMDEDSQFGDVIVPYLQPLPYVGTGFHRYIFVLYRQNNGSIDFQSIKRNEIIKDLGKERAFNSLDFYHTFQSELTPVGLRFFQSCWDESVRLFYRNSLGAPEPIFELDWPSPQLPPQSRFPLANSWCRARRHPHGLPLIRERYGVHSDVSFDVYLDRYRDRKDLQEELVRERLRTEGNPLDPSDPRRKRVEYPAALPMPPDMPSWWVRQEMQRRLRTGRWKYLEGHDG